MRRVWIVLCLLGIAACATVGIDAGAIADDLRTVAVRHTQDGREYETICKWGGGVDSNGSITWIEDVYNYVIDAPAHCSTSIRSTGQLDVVLEGE